MSYNTLDRFASLQLQIDLSVASYNTLDRFASFQIWQLPRFNSHCWNPGSEAVDAVTVNCVGEVNWWSPQFPQYIESFAMPRFV